MSQVTFQKSPRKVVSEKEKPEVVSMAKVESCENVTTVACFNALGA
jgi:hypothetical protein